MRKSYSILYDPTKDHTEWSTSGSNVTHRKIKWVARGLAQLVVGGAVLIWHPRLPDVTDLPTSAQFEAATAKRVTAVDCIRLVDPKAGQKLIRLVIDEIAPWKMMTPEEGTACQVAMERTIRLNENGVYPPALQEKDEWRQSIIDNLNRAIANNRHLPLKPAP